MSHIYITVAHRNHAQIFFAVRFTGSGKFCYRTDRRSFRHLTAGIRVHFRIQYQNIYVSARSDNVIQTAETDIVCPAVTADNPVRAFDKVIGKRKQFFCNGVGRLCQLFFQIVYVSALLCNCIVVELFICKNFAERIGSKSFVFSFFGFFARILCKLVTG